MAEVLVAGGGVAGLSAAWHAVQKGLETKIFEKETRWGGLLDYFEVEGFRFDKAVHFAFSNNKPYSDLLRQTKLVTHRPEPYNYSRGTWLKHPVQNNLFPLAAEEKVKAITSFLGRPEYKENGNYLDWLYSQFGTEIAERFPVKYTNKYWTVPPEMLSTAWIGNRIYRPSLEEVLLGAMSGDTPLTYYLPEMYYPQRGSFRSILEPLAKGLPLFCNREIVLVNPQNKFVECSDGHREDYKYFVSSIPLPELMGLIEGVPQNILTAADKLWSTSVALVSLGFKKPSNFRHLWFYIYDNDIYPSRAHSPHLKSSSNVPPGCSSIQFETYFSRYRPLPASSEEITEQAVNLVEMLRFAAPSDLIVSDYRVLPYANVVFDHAMIEARKIVLEYVKQLDILPVGRFGEWDYLWADQSYYSGKKVEELTDML